MKKTKLKIIGIFVAIFIAAVLVFSDLNFEGGIDKIDVKSAATDNVIGFAWSENIGWISFNAADVSGCPAGTCQPRYNSGTGELLGWARALANGGGWDGWISLKIV